MEKFWRGVLKFPKLSPDAIITMCAYSSRYHAGCKECREILICSPGLITQLPVLLPLLSVQMPTHPEGPTRKQRPTFRFSSPGPFTSSSSWRSLHCTSEAPHAFISSSSSQMTLSQAEFYWSSWMWFPARETLSSNPFFVMMANLSIPNHQSDLLKMFQQLSLSISWSTTP